MAAMNPEDISTISEDSPEIYRLLVGSVRDYAMFLLDVNGHVRSWNPGAERSKLYTKDEILGKHFSIFYTEEDARAGLPEKLLNLALQNGRVENEGWRVRKDGTHFWADVILTAVFNENGVHIGFAKVTRDLTERRHLISARDQALQASTAKSEFIANMSHELRTPLNAIIGYAEMMEEQVDEMDQASVRDFLAKILYSGRHLQSVIRDILDLSKIEAGRLELQESEVDVVAVLKEIAETVSPLAECNGNTIVYQVDQEVPVMLVDRTRLCQILYNLFSNALKFTRNGSVTAQVSMVPDGREPMVSIAIQDSGIGMSAEQAAGIFDRFKQVEEHVTRHNTGGTGLGLAICRMLSGAMKGSITCESTPGAGSTFTVYLPVAGARIKEVVKSGG